MHSEGASAEAPCELRPLKVGEGSLECGFCDTAHPTLEPRLESLQLGKGLSCQSQLSGSLLPLWLRIQNKLWCLKLLGFLLTAERSARELGVPLSLVAQYTAAQCLWDVVPAHRLLAQPLLWGGACRARRAVHFPAGQRRLPAAAQKLSAAACLSFPESLMDEPSQQRGGQGQGRSAFLKAAMDWRQDCATAALFQDGKRVWDPTCQTPGEVLVTVMRPPSVSATAVNVSFTLL